MDSKARLAFFCTVTYRQLAFLRNMLFEAYLKTPQDTRLVLEIKSTDDDITASVKQRNGNDVISNSAARSK